MKAINFSLPDQNNKIHSFVDYQGKWIVLYFYPKDDTPGCTKEACGFRDAFTIYKEKEIIVLGVSKDSTESHKNFADKYKLNFPLLSDIKGDLIRDYKAQGGFFTKRITYLIDPQGEIVKIYNKVDPLLHAPEILKDIDSLAKT